MNITSDVRQIISLKLWKHKHSNQASLVAQTGKNLPAILAFEWQEPGPQFQLQIFCRNIEVVLYLKKVILFSENTELLFLPLCMTPTSGHIICKTFGKKKNPKAKEDILNTFMWLSFLGKLFPCHPYVWHICLTLSAQGSGLTLFRDNNIVIFKIWKNKQIREWRNKHWNIIKESYQLQGNCSEYKNAYGLKIIYNVY